MKKNQFHKHHLSLSVVLSVSLLGSCAQLHHVQLADISDNSAKKTKIVDVKVSETGVNLEEAAKIAKVFARDARSSKAIDDVQNTIALFQMGPRTGNPVYVQDYAKAIPDMLKTECPNGKINNLVSIRETRKYPVISGEIVHIKAECLQ